MIHTRKSLWRGAIAVAAVAGFVTSAAAQMELKIMAAAGTRRLAPCSRP
jgi:putative tricarboxylic transport membrane protein